MMNQQEIRVAHLIIFNQQMVLKEEDEWRDFVEDWPIIKDFDYEVIRDEETNLFKLYVWCTVDHPITVVRWKVMFEDETLEIYEKVQVAETRPNDDVFAQPSMAGSQ